MHLEIIGQVLFPLRWTARILSLFSLGLLLLFIIGEGFNPLALTPRELLLSLFFPLGVLLGMAVGWRWEALGGILSLGSFAAFYVVHWLGSGRLPASWAFATFTVPGLLFLLAALARAQSIPRPNP